MLNLGLRKPYIFHECLFNLFVSSNQQSSFAFTYRLHQADKTHEHKWTMSENANPPFLLSFLPFMA